MGPSDFFFLSLSLSRDTPVGYVRVRWHKIYKPDIRRGTSYGSQSYVINIKFERPRDVRTRGNLLFLCTTPVRYFRERSEIFSKRVRRARSAALSISQRILYNRL